MKNRVARWIPILALVLVALVGPGVSEAFAQAQTTPFDLTSARLETQNMVRFLIGALMSILGVAGGATIVHGLVVARRRGEWGEFLGGVAMAVIAFVAFIAFLKMGNISADPSLIMRDFSVR